MVKRVCLIAMVALIALGASAPAAMAEDTECVGLLTGTFDDVVVPSGANCTLIGSTVSGNVHALNGSSLFSEGNQIGGNIEGDRPSRVASFSDHIGGNFDVTGAEGPGLLALGMSITVGICDGNLPGGDISVVGGSNGTILVGAHPVLCPGNDVGRGNILVQENVIPAPENMQLEFNTVAENMQVFKNRGSGLKSVAGNTVGEHLQCTENELPFLGGPNTAAKAEGQCF